METIIQTKNLTKHYGDVKAVDGIDLHVRKGEIYGFLGLNGAGKTTTIRMLLGMIKPTSGQSFLCNEEVTAHNGEIWNRVGHLVEIPYSYPNLTVKENLEIVARLRQLTGNHAINKIIKTLNLEPYANRKVRNLSMGNNQRLGLAKALIHQPEILILDEPTNGLDPAGIFEIRELLLSLVKNQGVTIFISSHILGEISKFATRIGIIHNGKMIRELDTPQLELLSKKKLKLKTNLIESTLVLLNSNNYHHCHHINSHIEVFDDRAIAHPEEIATLLVNNQQAPSLLHVEEEDLESYFLRTIGLESGQIKI